MSPITPATPGEGPGWPNRPMAGVGGDLAQSIADSLLHGISTWIADGATWLVERLGPVMNATTSLQLGSTWFTGQYRRMFVLAAGVMLPLLLVAVIQAIVRQNLRDLLRSFAVQLPMALLLSAIAVSLVQLALAVTDQLSRQLLAGSGNGVHSATVKISEVLVVLSLPNPAAPPFVVALVALLVALAALLLWLELLVRSAAIYVAVFFLPVTLITCVWPATAQFARRLVETLAALILSKFFIVAVLSLAAQVIGDGRGVSAVLVGAAMLLLASFVPFVLLRLIPMMEAGAALQLEGARHRVSQAFGSAPRSAASYALREVRAAGFATGSAGSAISRAVEPPGSTSAGSGYGGGASGKGTPGSRTASSAEPDVAASSVTGDPSGGSPVRRGRPSGRDGAGGRRGPTPGTGQPARSDRVDPTPVEAAARAQGPAGHDAGGTGIPMWVGDGASNEAYEAALAGGTGSSPGRRREDGQPQPSSGAGDWGGGDGVADQEDDIGGIGGADDSGIGHPGAGVAVGGIRLPTDGTPAESPFGDPGGLAAVPVEPDGLTAVPGDPGGLAADSGDPDRLGTVPVDPGGHGDATSAASSPDAPDGPASNDATATHAIERDAMGPVIRWRPRQQAPDEAPDAPAPDAPAPDALAPTPASRPDRPPATDGGGTNPGDPGGDPGDRVAGGDGPAVDADDG